jgi:hypothetical protein
MNYTIQGRHVVFEDGTQVPSISGGFCIGLSVAAIVSIAVTVAATAATIAVSIEQQQAQADYESKVNKYNARVQQQNAQMAKDSAEVKVAAIRRDTERQTATGVNLLAAAGGDVSLGSDLLYQLDQAGQEELAVRQARYAGDVQAAGNIAASQAYSSQAQYAQSQAAGTSLLTGIGGAAGAARGIGSTLSAPSSYTPSAPSVQV